jgi:hypothetical protein
MPHFLNPFSMKKGQPLTCKAEKLRCEGLMVKAPECTLSRRHRLDRKRSSLRATPVWFLAVEISTCDIMAAGLGYRPLPG